MRMKKIPLILMCGAACFSAVTGCTGSGDASKATPDSAIKETEPVKADVVKMHTLNIRAPKSVGEITATFMNTANGKTEDVKMEKSSENDQNIFFSCEADVNQYNMVHLTYGKTTSMDVAFNSFISGWNLSNDELLPYVVGTEPVYDPKFDTSVFQFDGRDKNVYIWKPVDYDEKAEEKYSVIYMFDGQSVLAKGTERGMDNDVMCWNVSENVESMIAATGNKAIIVAVDNGSPYRDDELIPDLGHLNLERAPANAKDEDISLKRGNAFADFICDTVMPYVNEHYNVYTDAQHTSLAGSSLGGLETFYTVLSHPDKFSAGGALSSTFGMYADAEWTSFLKDKCSMENAPFLYLYAGGYLVDNGDVTETMYNKLLESGYPKDKIIFSKYEPGEHFMQYWRNIYPEFLEAAFTQHVSALEYGVPIEYKDKSDPYEEYFKDLEIDMENTQPGYVYYDNSETKWDKVYVYWWGGMAINSLTNEPYYYAEWPGFQMEQIEGTDIYRVAAPFGVQGIIFDSGVTDKKVSEGADAYQTTDLPYSHGLIGKVYKIDMSVEPKADPGQMKTKRRYSAGNWSDYKPE